MDRRPRLGTRTLSLSIVLLLLVGVALRVRQYAACPSYWYDEAYLLLNVFRRSCLDLLGPLNDDQAAPPLFLWTLRGLYLIAGGGECWMRLPALAAGLAGLLVMVPLARRAAGRGWPWAVAFCALCHHAAAHSGEAKPYTLDLLTAELVLLVTLRCQSIVSKWRPRIALAVLAMLAPWASYPSVFVLAAAILSLLVRAFRRRDRRLLLFGVVLAALSASSGSLLWLLAVRHQATPSLGAFWNASFLDLSSPDAAAAWSGRCLIEIGNYGTREMGLPLVLLALVGVWSWRRRPERVVLLAGPVLLALLVCALRLYPLGGRLLFFLVPCVWLSAARGLVVLLRYLPRRLPRLARALPAVLLLPAALWGGRLLMGVTPRCQFREAFAHVAARRAAGDVLWVSHPQVYEVYHGRPPDLDAYALPQEVERAARTGRLWMVGAVAGPHDRPTAGDTIARVRAAPCAVLHHRRFKGLEVVLTAPQPETGSPPRSPEEE